ncbi:hypothetical protein CKM354_001037400 [Cercospora kikuchii]|uniref:Uncharacterized protein n=1 Tax=Cercospora kikuchii TaxID=84275 RepID=A0A9P3CYY8_9PEZI|nr:uncharacterized protein CKM354_001037400 [Cercospora kikuchii]GIZ47278.1 hypothetical protein CKM354_001037400 [Cercospora kikuchii]
MATTTPAEYTGVAAGKVFAIPELLENILLLGVADQFVEGCRIDDGFKRQIWPTLGCGRISEDEICLFSIQRASKVFRHTIQGSLKLKQLMFLAPLPNAELVSSNETKDVGDLELHKPLGSLLAILGLSEAENLTTLYNDAYEDEDGPPDGIDRLKMIITDDFVCTPGTPYDKTIGKLPKGWHNPEASWRKLRICNAKAPAPIKLRIWSPYVCDNEAPPFDITFPLEKDATMEHVFDLLERFMVVLGEYRDKMVALLLEYEVAKSSPAANTEAEHSPIHQFEWSRGALADQLVEALEHCFAEVQGVKVCC